MEPEYQEITLADIVRTLHRRKFILGGVFLLALLAGVAITVFATPEYESSAIIIPLEHPDIIKNWLSSRNASAQVVDAMGDPLRQQLFPGRWDDTRLEWTGGPPPREEAARRLSEATSVTSSLDPRSQQGDRKITLTVALPDGPLARDAADAYVRTLDVLRPALEQTTQNQRFAEFYQATGSEQEANRQAEIIAQNTIYWIVLDSANTPKGPSSPNVTLNIALSVVLGLMAGVFAVFLWEWVRNFKAEGTKVELPPAPAGAETEARSRRYG